MSGQSGKTSALSVAVTCEPNRSRANVDAAANLFLGREMKTRWGTLDDTAMEAEARKVMGMTVFSGMLIATILGVCLIPMLYVVIEKMIGGAKKHAPAASPTAPPALAGHGHGGH